MRVLVCGGRDYGDWQKVYAVLNGLLAQHGGLTVITGGARGADDIAHRWAKSHRRVESLQFFADWERHGKAAGPKRNQLMLDAGRPDLVVAFPGGRGTADMVGRAAAAGVTLRQIT